MSSSEHRGVSSQYWRRTASSIPSVNDRTHIEHVLRAYVESWNSENAASRAALFADDIVIEDPATVVRATGRAELEAFFSATIPADWKLRFGYVRSVVVGDEAVLTYTVVLTIGERSPSELLVNSHVLFDGSGRISSLRVFYDDQSITDQV
jgi:steroid Delta-isomerase